jgi:hypothetical protein
MSKRSIFINKSNPSKKSQTGNHHTVLDFVPPPKLISYEQSRGESFDILNYLKVEVLGIGEPGQMDPPHNENIMNFLNVPWQLECLLMFGCVICLDAFLYVITYLPIRVIFSIFLFMVEGLKQVKKIIFKESSYRSMFHRTQVYDLMRGLMLLIGVLVLRQINMSQVYHFIRGQNMIKLYVLASMMEVMDKLFASFGQDAFDALHIQTRSNPKSLKLVKYFLITSLYVVAHSALYFFEVATYTVVVNSSDEALLTVLILNNFAELKSFVFKKFDNNNLFQLACSDITERFQITLFLMTIMFVAVTQNDFNWNELAPGFIRILALMAFGESIADSVKHAFINKFNSISPDVYEDFAFVLRLDILGNRKDKIILDHSYAVTRRLGLSQVRSMTISSKAE